MRRRHQQPRQSAVVPIEQLVGGLAANMDGVVAALGLQGRREGADYVAFNPLRADNHLGSFRICCDGAKAGIWADFAMGGTTRSGVLGGDALDLVAYIACGGDKRRAVAWARHFLGYDDGNAPAAVQGAAGRKRAIDHEKKKTRGQALRLWLEAQASLRHTAAAAYLYGRGIDLAALGRQPRALRYHPKLYNRESNRHWPALVAAVSAPDGKTVAVHRTWLEVGGTDPHDGRLVVAKAPLEDAKMTLGQYSGGAIRLWRGLAMDPETGELTPAKPLKDAAPGSAVAITEGIEDGLTVALAKPDWRILVAVSLANMGAIALPDAITTVILCADNDAEGSPAAAALERAIAHYHAQGKVVKIARPSKGKDVNDRLRGAG